jgi:ParB family chromosome partitioning protein
VPRKNTPESAAHAARLALERTPQLLLADNTAAIPARQEGRIPLRNSYRIELSLIEPDPDQPRQHFDPHALQELSDSIRARDVRQPITVRWIPETSRYRIIDGERRFRAAAQAGLTDIPCVIYEGQGKEILVDQIVQNWQRADLRPYETADALVRLKSEFGMSVREIAGMTGKSAGEVSKLIALVERVAPDVQQRVRQVGEISLTKRHLYALTQLEPEQQMRLALRIERHQLTADETERLVRTGAELHATGKQPGRGRPRKHVRIPTRYGLVQLTPDAPDYDDHFLIAMLHEARRQLSAE